MSLVEIWLLLFPGRSGDMPAFFRATLVRSFSLAASYSHSPLYTYKFLLFMCLDWHLVLLHFTPFLAIQFRNPQIFCPQAKENTCLFGRSHITSKWIVHLPHVDNFMLGFHLAGHTPSFECPFTLSCILYYSSSPEESNRREDNTVLFQPTCKIIFNKPHLQIDWYPLSPSTPGCCWNFKNFKCLRT